MKNNYITFKEMLNELVGYNVKFYNVPSILEIVEENFEADFNITAFKVDSIFNNNPLTNELFERIFELFYNQYVYEYSKSSDVVYEFKLNFFIRLTRKIKNTYLYYSTMINLYKSNESKLLDKLQTISKTSARYNDTPAIEADFTNEGYASNVTIAEGSTESDSDTIIKRISEIRKEYRDMLGEWAVSFRELFIDKEVIENEY